MHKEPNGRKVNINLSISRDNKKWLKDRPWINASGILDTVIEKMRAKGDDFF